MKGLKGLYKMIVDLKNKEIVDVVLPNWVKKGCEEDFLNHWILNDKKFKNGKIKLWVFQSMMKSIRELRKIYQSKENCEWEINHNIQLMDEEIEEMKECGCGGMVLKENQINRYRDREEEDVEGICFGKTLYRISHWDKEKLCEGCECNYDFYYEWLDFFKQQHKFYEELETKERVEYSSIQNSKKLNGWVK